MVPREVVLLMSLEVVLLMPLLGVVRLENFQIFSGGAGVRSPGSRGERSELV